MKSKIFSKVLMLGACAAFLLTSSAYAATKVRISGNFPVDHSSSLAMEVFKEELAKESGGDLTVDVFPAMQLGGA